MAVGAAVGAAVGLLVGDAVGPAVGFAVGVAVGAAVGIAKHSCAPSWFPVHVPNAQSWHTAYACWSWYLPDGQCRHSVWPTQAEYVPAAHEWHVLPDDGWYLPAMQSVQADDPGTENCPPLPALHGLHKSALYVLENVPGGHGAQCTPTRD